MLLKLALLTGNDDFERRATTCLRTLVPYVDQAATAFGHLLSALDFHLSRPQELAIVWQGGRGGVDALVAVAREGFRPNMLLAGAPAGEGADISPLLQDRPAIAGAATAYLCERYVCQAPTTDPSALREQLEAL